MHIRHLNIYIIYCILYFLDNVQQFIIRIPEIAFTLKMREKSVTHVLSVKNEDPSTTKGMVEVLKSCMQYVPTTSDNKNIRRDIVLHGK